MTVTSGKKPRPADSEMGIKVPFRKLVVVPLSESVPHPPLDSFFESEWNTSIKPMILAIFDNKSVPRELCYRKIESLVNCGFTSQLADLVRCEFRAHCQTIFMRSPRNRVHDTAKSILESFEKFSKSVNVIVGIFNALDRRLIWENASDDLSRMAFGVWRELVCETGLTGIVVEEILTVVENLRRTFINQEIATDQSTEFLSLLVSMNVKIGTFDSHVGDAVIKKTREWYADIGSDLASEKGVDEYAGIVHSLMLQEKQMLESTSFPPSTWRKIDHEILRSELIMKNFPNLIERDLGRLIESSSNSDCLSQIFELCNKFPEKILTESVLKFAFGESVKLIAKSAIATNDIIPNLIAAREKFIGLIESSFENKPTFFSAFKDSMENIINHSTVHIPMLLGDYFDAKIWTDILDRIDDPIDPSTTWLSSGLALFKFVASKDLFEVHYRNFLAKRLIYIGCNLTTCGNGINYETAIIALLKAECGAGYTNKLEGMVKDILASEDFNGVQDGEGKDRKCIVITTGVWPSIITATDYAGIPLSVREYEKNFVEVYKKNFPKKSVKFVHSLSCCIVRFNRRYELVCSGPQAMILDLFNDGSDSMSVDVILQELRFPVAEFERALRPMVDVGLVANTNGVVEVNSGWHPKTPGQVILNTYQYRRESDEGSPVVMNDTDRLQTESSVAEDRQHQLDALIVRIMKKNKSVTLNGLLREIVENLPASFTTFYSQTELKKRIDSLVDREFLEKISSVAEPDNVEIRYLI